MRVKTLFDLTPHEAMYEQAAFSGHFLPVYEGVNITYYKRYRQADITPPEGYSCPYVEYGPTGQEEHTLLTGTAAKIMLMREIINKIGVGGQLTLNLEGV